jgi:hypothetical protein
MTQNETLIFDSLFLHDTQMTDLEREQTTLRKIWLKLTAESPSIPGHGTVNPQTGRPFNFTLPFCPVDESVDFEGKLTIGPTVVRGGWIVRSVSGQKHDAPGEADRTGDHIDQTHDKRIDIPGYPQLPDGPCFILGFAGYLADEVLARAEPDGKSGVATTTGIAKEFSVSARYRATVTLEIGYGEPSSFCSAWTVGPARWEKA